MSVAIYIVTRRDDQGVDTFVEGKAMGRADESLLDSLCQKAGICPIQEYISSNPDELAEFFEEEPGDMPEAGELPDEHWFKPEEGREWVEKLLAVVLADVASIPGAGGLLEDLRDYARIFAALEAAGVEWHFAVDF